jgi:hypothetical protein
MVRIVLIVLEILIGIAALAGGANATLGARGVPREWLKGTPFKSYLVPGIVLIILVGGSMLVAAGLLIGGVHVARVVSLEAGIILLAWVGAQFATIGYRHVMQPLSLGLGLAIVVLAFALPSPG